MRVLGPIRQECRISIAIPAKDEAAAISFALAAFSEQRALDGAAIDPDLFEVIVLANDCTDDTAGIVRAFATAHPDLAIHVVSCDLPRDAAHVGTARRMALDIACERQERLRGGAGIVASTDADSCVDRFWVAQTVREMEGVDVVAGHVEIATVERAAMDDAMRELYDRERTYRRLLGELESLYDPRPFDAPPRHNAFVGASFAVLMRTYVEAGRLPICVT